MASQNLGFDINPHGTELVVVQTTFLILSWIVCVLRGYVRVFLIRKISLEDWLMLVALGAYTAMGVIVVHSVALGGTGKHTRELTREGIATALRAWYLGEVLYPPLAAFVRTSIAVFLLHIAVEKWHVWVIRFNIGIIWILSIVYFFLMTMQCSPPSYFWRGPVDPTAEGSCLHKDVVPISTVVYSVVSAVSDWMLALLPIAMLWHVRINLQTKIGVAILLGMGILAGVAQIIRIFYVKRIGITADFLFDTVDTAIWSVIEPSLGIIAGCIATLRPLFVNFGIGLKKATKKYGSKPASGGNSDSGWRVKMHKLSDKPHDSSFNSKSAISQRREAHESEIELNLNPHREHQHDYDGVQCDVEGASTNRWDRNASGINVQKTFDSNSHRTTPVDREPSDSSSWDALPMQGQQTVLAPQGVNIHSPSSRAG